MFISYELWHYSSFILDFLRYNGDIGSGGIGGIGGGGGGRLRTGYFDDNYYLRRNASSSQRRGRLPIIYVAPTGTISIVLNRGVQIEVKVQILLKHFCSFFPTVIFK